MDEVTPEETDEIKFRHLECKGLEERQNKKVVANSGSDGGQVWTQ